MTVARFEPVTGGPTGRLLTGFDRISKSVPFDLLTEKDSNVANPIEFSTLEIASRASRYEEGCVRGASLSLAKQTDPQVNANRRELPLSAFVVYLHWAKGFATVAFPTSRSLL